jgi:hypothetical protein
MRTPNTACILCAKPLYRRPYELAKVRYAACMACRAKAQSVVGVTEAQERGLKLGRPKGTNHRAGYKHKPESRAKCAATNKRFWAQNPEKAMERGCKLRAELHYKWKGGISRLNLSIRLMTENRKWMDAVKERDGHRCVRCGSADRLESHHIEELADLVARHNIKSRDDARACAELWALDNGETLCAPCHDVHHGRAIREAA